MLPEHEFDYFALPIYVTFLHNKAKKLMIEFFIIVCLKKTTHGTPIVR